MSTLVQVEGLADQLIKFKSWDPPHRGPIGGKTPGQTIPEDVIRKVVNASFFASLRAEEGHHHEHGMVLVQSSEQLAELTPPWRVLAFSTPLPLEVDSIAKLAPALVGDRRFLVVVVATGGVAPSIVGLAEAPAAGFLRDDHYPRVRSVGPGDLVFYRGGDALFRYRAGYLDELRPDFFGGSSEPTAVLQRMGASLFSHWTTPDHALSTWVVAGCLARMVESVAAVGHGGLVVVQAPEEPVPTPLREACAYPIDPFDLGDITLHAFEGGMRMRSLDDAIRGAGPDYIPTRAYTTDEYRDEAEWREAQAIEDSFHQTLAGMAAVDGAVLVAGDLKVHGFGCRLPGLTGSSPKVLEARGDPQGQPNVYDLRKHGTRHTAAALFADAVHGRMAFTVSADGPAGCFMWSDQYTSVVHWPIHVGAFARRW